MIKKIDSKNWWVILIVGVLVYILDFLVKTVVTFLNLSHYFKEQFPEGFNLKFQGTTLLVNDEIQSISIMSLPNFGTMFLLSSVVTLIITMFLLRFTVGLKILEFESVDRGKVFRTSLYTIALMVGIYLIQNWNASFQTEFITKEMIQNGSLVVFILAFGIGAPIIEEIIFRGLILRAISDRFGYATGIVLASFIFTVLHIQYSWTVLLLVFITSLFLCAVKNYSKNIWAPIAVHVFINTFGILMVALT